MKSLKQITLDRRATRLSRETGYHRRLCREALGEAERWGLTHDDAGVALAAARRDKVPPVEAVQTLARRRLAALSALAVGDLEVDLRAQPAPEQVAASVGEGAFGLDLGPCAAEVRAGGAVAVVVLRPQRPVQRTALDVAAAAGRVTFSLPAGSRAAQLVADRACSICVAPECVVDGGLLEMVDDARSLAAETFGVPADVLFGGAPSGFQAPILTIAKETPCDD